jgi:hypothetical protein
MDEEESKPNVGFMLYEMLPAEFEAGLVEGLAADDLDVRVLRISSGPFAGIELYLPAAAMMFIATTYFSGFLQKAGEDHYELLKRAAKKLWARARGLRITAVASSPGKLSKSPYSLAYAIVGEANEGLRFKFVLKMTVDEAEADQAITAFFDLLKDIHVGALGEENLRALLTYRPIGGTVLVTFDPKRKQIVPVNAFDRHQD